MEYSGYIGEHLIPEMYKSNPENYVIYLLHLKTYEFVFDYVKDKRVLDFGCGDGYGASLLSDYAKEVTGIDIAKEGMAAANEKYKKQNLRYVVIEPTDTTPLPFADQSFDIVVSFQVIEHVGDVLQYLHEIKRVLTPDGQYIVTTPNGSFRLLPFQNPWNQFHKREYTEDQFRTLLGQVFQNRTVKGLTLKDKAYAIERKRIGRNKWVLWLVTNKLVPEILRQFFLTKIKQFLKKEKSSPSSSAEVELPPEDSIMIVDDNLNQSPDFLAICDNR